MENIEMSKKDKRSVHEWAIEIANIVKVFLVPYKGVNGVKRVPDIIKKKGTFFGFLNLVLTLIALIFSFMLKGTNMLIEHKFIVLGILLFMLYKGESLIEQLIRNYLNIEREAYSQIFDDEVVAFGTDILGKTAGKVFKYNEKLGMSIIMENERLINCIKRYVQSFWNYHVKHKFDVIEMISVLIMLVTVFLTNSDIPNGIFIPFVLIFAILAFVLTAYKIINKRECWNREREFQNEQSVLVNDMLRVKPIVAGDLTMRIERFKTVSKANRENKQNLNHKLNRASIVNMAFELLFQYGVIIFYVMQIKWQNVTLGSITLITANLALLKTALGRIAMLVGTFHDNAEVISVLDREAEDLKQIMFVYDSETKRIENDKPVERIDLEPFKVQYEKKNEEDIPFTLISSERIIIEQGDVVVFKGPSGSGKSTVMKMLMDQVRLGKSVEIPNTSRFLYFDETLHFGNMSIYDEFFAGSEVYLSKAYAILESLHLSQELKFNRDTMETWMKKNFYKSSMSHGQKQRMVLAKLLYHLDDNIDMLLLDEATSGLDEKANEGMDAQAMLKYCIRFANLDRKRIVLLSTHQSYEGCKNDLEKEGYRFKIFEFGNGEIHQIFE